MTALDSLLRWPLDTDGWQHTFLVGTLLVATLPLAVPGILLAGYAVRLLRAEPDDPTLPTFADLRSLAGTGLRAAGIVVAYHLPAAGLLAAGTAGVASALRRWRALPLLRPGGIVGAFDLANRTETVGVALLGMALLPVCGYVATVAVTAYADTDDVTAAFAIGRLRDRMCAVATLRAWPLTSLVVASGIRAAILGGRARRFRVSAHSSPWPSGSTAASSPSASGTKRGRPTTRPSGTRGRTRSQRAPIRSETTCRESAPVVGRDGSTTHRDTGTTIRASRLSRRRGRL